MLRKKLTAIVASILTIVSCCMLFSACAYDHFASLNGVTFVGDELTVYTNEGYSTSYGNLTIENKRYFVGIESSDETFVIWDLTDITELQEENCKWEWRICTTLVEKTGDKRIFEHKVELYTKEGERSDQRTVFPIWNGYYKDDVVFTFLNRASYIEFTIDEDLLSEREGTPSYVGKTIRLERQ